MGFLQILAKLLAPLVGIFAKQGKSAFVLPGGEHLVIDIVFFQQTVKIGQLGHHTDGPDKGKRCGKNLVGDAGHHIATAGCHLVDTNGQRNTALANAIQLTGSQALILGHSRLIAGIGLGQHSGNLLAQ